MGLKAMFTAQKAMRLHNDGKIKEAIPLYEEAMKGGAADMRVVLAYAVLLIREGEYTKAKDLLVQHQKDKMSAEQKTQLFMNYAACCYKLGDIDKGVNLLERQHLHQPTGMVYETLGYLYVEKYAANSKDAFAQREMARVKREAEERAREAAEMLEEGEEVPETVIPEIDVEALWQEGVEKALAFEKEAADYDEDDAITWDNLAQFYYRVLEDKATARPYFDKALAIKPGQIDTLWFLSRYDLEGGDKAAALEKLETALSGRFSPLNYVTKAEIEQEIQRLKQ